MQKLTSEKQIENEMHETYSVSPSYHSQKKASSLRQTNTTAQSEVQVISHQQDATHILLLFSRSIQVLQTKPEIEHRMTNVINNAKSELEQQEGDHTQPTNTCQHVTPTLAAAATIRVLLGPGHTHNAHWSVCRALKVMRTTSPAQSLRNAHSPHGEANK